MKQRIGFPVLMLLVLSGCVSRAELTAQREAINQGTTMIRQDHHEWAQAIAGVPGHSLPDLSNVAPEQRQSWLNGKLAPHEAYDKWLNDGRARDKAGWFGGGK